MQLSRLREADTEVSRKFRSDWQGPPICGLAHSAVGDNPPMPHPRPWRVTHRLDLQDTCSRLMCAPALRVRGVGMKNHDSRRSRG